MANVLHRYHKGRRPPKNLPHLRRLSFFRNGHLLKSLPKATAPSWDSRTLGWIGPIKDQSQCGSCWCFSGTGIIEVAYNKAGVGGGAGTFVLSEEYTLSCGQNGGCNGDDNTTVLIEAKATGIPLSTAYGPYNAGDGSPGQCSWSAGQTLYKIPDWGFADSNGGQGVTSVQDIKNAIMAYGAAGVAIAADDAFMSNPSGTVFMGSGSQDIDHDVILVGWQDDSTIPSGGYWILRNSWGTSWCENGYIRIAYGANLVGTEAVFALGPTPIPPGPSPQPATLTIAVPQQPVYIGGLDIGHVPAYTLTAILPPSQSPIGSYGDMRPPLFSRKVSAKAIPSWLLAALDELCVIGAAAPAPISIIAAELCPLLPQAKQTGTIAIPAWLVPVLAMVCGAAGTLPAPYSNIATALCSLLPLMEGKQAGCGCH